MATTRIQNTINRNVNGGTGGANLNAQRTAQDTRWDPNTGARTRNRAGRNNRFVNRSQRYYDLRKAFGLSVG